MALTKITTSVVAVNSLTSANIADNSIDATKIANNQILARHIAADALSDQIADNAIGIAQLNVSDGSSGQALVTNGSGTLSFSTVAISGISSSADATAITIDSSENVGIGTSPTKRLTVGNSDATAFIASGGSNVHLTLSANGASGAVILRTGGTNGNPDTTTERMRIDSSGNVGIGVTTPTNYYSGGDNLVVGTGTGEGGITLASTGTDQWNYILFADGTSGDAQYRGQIAYNHSADNMAVTSSGFVSILTGSGRSEKMRVDANGNLGVGDTSPANFSGYVVASLADSTGGIIDFKTTGSEGVFGRIQGVVNNQLAITNKQAYPLTFGTNDTERMRIESDGDVTIYGTIGTNSSTAFASMAGRLQFDTDYSDTQRGPNKIVLQEDGAWIAGIGVSNGSTDFYSGGHITFRTGTSHGTERMRITSGGKLFINTTAAVRGSETVSIDGGSADCFALKTHAAGAVIRKQSVSNGFLFLFENSSASAVGSITTDASNTTYNTSSDYRLKENIEPMQNGLERLNQLNPVKFSWKETGIKSEGFIAHEVDEVFSDCIYGKKDGEEIQSMDYGRITPLLVKAIQEQQEQIEELKGKLENK